MIRARIGGLEARGFRCFQKSRSFTFRGPDEHPPATVVVAGPNGSGKSSLFEAILYALGREDLLHRQLQDEHRRQWLRAALAADVRVRLTLSVFSAPGTVLGIRTPCQVKIDRSHSGWNVRVGEEAMPVSDDQEVIRSLLGDLPVEWFSSWRQPYLSGPVRPMSEIPDFARGEASRLWQVKQRMVDERTRSAFGGPPGQDIDWLDQLNRAWSALRGDDGTRFAVIADPLDTTHTRFDLYVQRSSPEFGDIPVCPVDQLSSGELEWLALVGTLITTSFDGIVLVDEPELHLHPEWQAQLLPALRGVAPDAQLVIATHADPPWDQVYSFERVLLVAPDDPRAQAEAGE
jgi:predicted ATPase